MLTIGALVVDLAAHEATIDGDPLVMQPQQFRILVVLAKHVGGADLKVSALALRRNTSRRRRTKTLRSLRRS
jgi:hypothetical protein